MPTASLARPVRLLLIRHGRSAHPPTREQLDRAGVERWRAGYDAAGIADDDAPPAALVHEVASAHALLASDLPRAIASAARLSPGRAVTTTPLLREHPLPLPPWLGHASLSSWEAAIHLRWWIERAIGRDADATLRARARDAADWCASHAAAAGDGATLAAVTHGVFRRLLARALVDAGWRFEPGRRSFHNWSVWRLRTDHRELGARR